ncbi:hypothetical protein [Sphingopyxis sp. USTB-05]|uniref:hypothetical protein n=1 Tax=Sphingopyxis sp. USTB-05 TaxID=2830667 RepID=UPI00207878C1|nr:hypothetical protein [Sphingopyxis sp. USTB-05]USI78216.1 hypothetical protein KEC45_04740 [Sphingopyxis sp. USTB-05]
MSRAVDILHGGRWRDIAARVLAAVPLNYAVTSALTMLIARLLPGGAQQASVGATLMSFLIFAGLAMTAFAVRSVSRLWAGLIATGVIAALADWCLIDWGGRL